MTSNENLNFKSVCHVDNFCSVINSEHPNLYQKLCNGEKVDSFEIAYYYILSSFLEREFLLNVKTNARDNIHKDFIIHSENILLDFAHNLMKRSTLDLSLFSMISDDDKVLLKTGIDIAFDDLSITTDVLFDVISTAHQKEIELTNKNQEYYGYER